MEGVTDLPFRRFIRELSKDKQPFFVSEFLSTGSSLFLTPVNTRAVRFDKEEEPFCMQLFGHNAERLSAAALQVQELGAAFVELNAGCPAPKIANKGSGSGLLRDLPNLQKILQSMKSVLKIPLFLKCRLGWDENSIVINEVLEMAEGCGVEQLTIHGRTKVQGYKGLANWNAIGEIAAKAKIPIIGNGDIDSAEKALNAVKNYEVKGVAIGRAVLRNPWIFSQIANAETKKITASDACNAVLRYEKLLRADSMREGQIIGRLKQLSARLCLEFSPDFRLKVLHSETVREILDNWGAIVQTI
ncbi:MAG: tRNA-dihydrouridine synthase family protein [Fibromonadaceae bacterium]|jgi:nifR3 family TIM-barrel protein|nr:tRNA-dihydrouridine synthase family protein [Fibromonadaceae bacterium]